MSGIMPALHIVACLRILASGITTGCCRTLRLCMGITMTIAMRVGRCLRREAIAGRCSSGRCGLGCGRLFR